MANDAQGYYSNLCHFSFVCWFKKMPQITGRRKRLTLKEKPIECKLCDKKFLQHNNINRHEGNKPFKRNVCEKEFRLINVFLGFTGAPEHMGTWGLVPTKF